MTIQIHCTLNTSIPAGILPPGVKHCQVVTQPIHLKEIPRDFAGLIMDDRDEDDLGWLVDSNGADIYAAAKRYIAKNAELRAVFPKATIGQYNIALNGSGSVQAILERNRWALPVLMDLPVSFPPLYLRAGGNMDDHKNTLVAALMLHPRVIPVIPTYYLTKSDPTYQQPVKNRELADLLYIMQDVRVPVYRETRRVHEVALWMADPVQWKWIGDTATNKTAINSGIKSFVGAVRKAEK